MLKADIDKDLKAAMISGDKRLVEILRSMKSAILYKEVSEGKRESGLSDPEIITVLKKEVKSRLDAVALYEQAQDAPRVEVEQYQIDVISRYIPAAPSFEIVEQLVREAMTELGIEEIQNSDTGKLIGAVKKREPLADGADIARVIQNIKGGTK